ncbi:MAG: hypothetical protein ACRCX2_00985, partial [Paraclostridium sp.]
MSEKYIDYKNGSQETRTEILKGNINADTLISNSKKMTRTELQREREVARLEAIEYERVQFYSFLARYRKAVEITTHKKGEVNVEVVYLPFPTHEKVLKNKELSMRTYGTILSESKFGGKVRNLSDRYIYLKDVDENIQAMSDYLSTNGKKVSTRTIKKYIKALSKCSMNILEPVKNFDDEVFYKINYSVDEK